MQLVSNTLMAAVVITMWVYACQACMRLQEARPLDFSLQGSKPQKKEKE